jgi:hypothetical protein
MFDAPVAEAAHFGSEDPVSRWDNLIVLGHVDKGWMID